MKAKLIDNKFGEMELIIPDELIRELNWKSGDELKIEVSDVCENTGEHQGIIISNISKNGGLIEDK